ncbi:MAG: hypothetical protein PHH58_03220 [Rhodoferax sp.]|nr:hypothetical protein [Rhodoferax sp.]
MSDETINAETVFSLMYDLFMAHPWLNAPGVMLCGDAVAEQEAAAFLLAGDLSCQWGECSPGAQRVVNHLLLDFIAKLGTTMVGRSWQIPAELTKTKKVLSVIASEIQRSHPHLQLRH